MHVSDIFLCFLDHGLDFFVVWVATRSLLIIRESSRRLIGLRKRQAQVVPRTGIGLTKTDGMLEKGNSIAGSMRCKCLITCLGIFIVGGGGKIKLRAVNRSGE